jgi:hypothetical protein
VNLLEKERRTASEEDLRNYLDTVSIQLETVPSLFIWNADETRVDIPKECASPQVIVAKQTRPRTITVPKKRDDSSLAMLTAISALGDSTPPTFISKNKTFISEALARQKLYHDHGYVIRNSAKTFMTKVLFIDWPQTQFIPRNNELGRKIDSDGPIILLVDGHTSHITPAFLLMLLLGRSLSSNWSLTHHTSANRWICAYLVSLRCCISEKQKHTK